MRGLQQHWGACPGGGGPDAPGCETTGPTGPYENLEMAVDLQPGCAKKEGGEARNASNNTDMKQALARGGDLSSRRAGGKQASSKQAASSRHRLQYM